MRIFLASDLHLEMRSHDASFLLVCEPCLNEFGLTPKSNYHQKLKHGSCGICKSKADLFSTAATNGLRRDSEWSDYPKAGAVDLVVLAGDIGSHTRGLDWACRKRKGQVPVVYVAGNHEYYGAHLGMVRQMQDTSREVQQVFFLEKNTYVQGDVRVLGCTLWTNFKGWQEGSSQSENMMVAECGINDFVHIYGRGQKPITGSDMVQLHRAAAAFLSAELSKPWDGKTVVVSHFAPHPQADHARFKNSIHEPYFQVDMRWLMRKHKIDLWCYGHTHWSLDFVCEETGTRIVSNQGGYNREDGGFNPLKIIEI